MHSFHMMFPNPALDFLQQILTDPAWSRLAMLLRWGFLLGLGALLFRFPLVESVNSVKNAHRYVSWFWAFWMMVFLLCIGFRQAQWQLMGRQNEDFISFMQRYDRREFNPAHRVRAGKILDRKGEVLVSSPMKDQVIRRHYRFGPVASHAIGYNHPVFVRGESTASTDVGVMF